MRLGSNEENSLSASDRSGVAVYIVSRYHNRTNPLTVTNVEGTRPIAPDFSLTDIAGRKLELSNYRGKVVLIDFWATWCAPCRSEIPRLVELQTKYRSRGLEILGISLDEERKPVETFSKEFQINYPVALGDAQVAESYGGILGLPVKFLVGRDGRIYAKYVGEADMAKIEHDIKPLL